MQLLLIRLLKWHAYSHMLNPCCRKACQHQTNLTVSCGIIQFIGSQGLSFKQPLLSVNLSVLCSVCLSTVLQSVSSPSVLVGIRWWYFNRMFSYVVCLKWSSAAPPPFRPDNPSLCGSHPLLTP